MSEKEKKFNRDKEEKIRKIIQTTMELIKENGYDNVSTNHIATKAGIGIGTVYRNFPEGKNAIILEIAKQKIEQMLDYEIFSQISDENFDLSVNLFVKEYVRLHKEDYVFYKAIEIALLGLSQIQNQINDVAKQHLTRIVEKIQKLKRFKTVEKDILEEKLLIVYNLLETLIHRQIFTVSIFPSEEELIFFLTKLVLFIFKEKLLEKEGR